MQPSMAEAPPRPTVEGLSMMVRHLDELVQQDEYSAVREMRSLSRGILRGEGEQLNSVVRLMILKNTCRDERGSEH